jgi:hypothetical protein
MKSARVAKPERSMASRSKVSNGTVLFSTPLMLVPVTTISSRPGVLLSSPVLFEVGGAAMF